MFETTTTWPLDSLISERNHQKSSCRWRSGTPFVLQFVIIFIVSTVEEVTFTRAGSQSRTGKKISCNLPVFPNHSEILQFHTAIVCHRCGLPWKFIYRQKCWKNTPELVTQGNSPRVFTLKRHEKTKQHDSRPKPFSHSTGSITVSFIN